MIVLRLIELWYTIFFVRKQYPKIKFYNNYYKL